MKFKYPVGATPLNKDEMDDLIPLHITTQNQLNEWEAANISKAEQWLFSKKHPKNFLTIDFLRLLHKKMFDETWKWAGVFRNSEKNIGVAPYQITTELKKLLDDIVFQMEHATYSIDEIAYRFHHKLVWIHPFANGNGRHARLMVDYFLIQADETRFTWGNKNLIIDSATRQHYLDALQNADKRDYKKLATFVRS